MSKVPNIWRLATWTQRCLPVARNAESTECSSGSPQSDARATSDIATEGQHTIRARLWCRPITPQSTAKIFGTSDSYPPYLWIWVPPRSGVFCSSNLWTLRPVAASVDSFIPSLASSSYEEALLLRAIPQLADRQSAVFSGFFHLSF